MSGALPEPSHDLEHDVAELAEAGEGIDTEIASFFDVGYVSPNQQGSEFPKRARKRTQKRGRTPPTMLRR